MIARAAWEVGKSALGGHYAITPNTQGAHAKRDAAWRGRGPSWCVYARELLPTKPAPFELRGALGEALKNWLQPWLPGDSLASTQSPLHVFGVL